MQPCVARGWVLVFMAHCSMAFVAPSTLVANVRNANAPTIYMIHTETHARTPRRDQQSALKAVALPSISQGSFYMSLLALQFACQPVLTKAFAPKTLTRSTYVLIQDLVRSVICLAMLLLTGSWSSATQSWTWLGALAAAGIPAVLYAVQNYCSLMAYQNLPPITYNVLNQTKTLSAALWCYMLVRQLQSKLQIVSLFLLLLSALIMESVIPLPFVKQKSAIEDASERRTHWVSGVLPILAASMISGLAGAYVQRTLQHHERNSLLFSAELATVSAFSLIFTLISGTPDSKKIRTEGFWKGWTSKTWIPLMTNATGGILVGLVTKYAGSVRKGFALIIGLFLSGVIQNYMKGEKNVTFQQWVGGALVAVSLWMHSNFPHVP